MLLASTLLSTGDIEINSVIPSFEKYLLSLVYAILYSRPLEYSGEQGG